VVTVPRDAAPDLLWTRFATLVGLDPARFELESSPANTSLHAEQAELLRRVNTQLGDRLPMPGPYPQTVKDVLAQTLLAARPGTPVGLVGDDRQFAVARSQVIVDELRHLDVDVVGDLTDLLPADDPGPARGVTELPETTPDSVLLGESVEALSGLLERFGAERDEADGNRQRLESELSRCRGELDGLQARHDALQSHDDKLVHDMRYRPIRHLVIGVSERRPWLMRIRVGYWRTANAVRRVTSRTRSDRTG